MAFLDMLESLGRGIGDVAAVPLTGLAMLQAARSGRDPRAVLQQSALQHQELQRSQQAGLIQKATALYDPAMRAYLTQNPDAAEVFGLHTVPRELATPEMLETGGYAEPGGPTIGIPPARLGVVPPPIETSQALQRRQLEANINWLNTMRQAARNQLGMGTEGAGPGTAPGAPPPGITAGSSPAGVPTPPPVGGQPTPGGQPETPASSMARPAPGETSGPPVGGGSYMDIGPSGPTIRPRKLTVHNLPAGTPDPITGQPLTRARTIRGVAGDTILVPTPSPGQLQQAQRTKSALDTINDLEKKLVDPKYATAVGNLGPLDPIGRLTGGLTGGWTAIPGSNPYWFNYRYQGGKALDPETREVMESLGFLAGTGFQGLTAGIRHKDVLDDIRVHLPNPASDTLEQVQGKIAYLRSRYEDILQAIPSAIAAALSQNPDDMSLVTPEIQQKIAQAADAHVEAVGREHMGEGTPTPGAGAPNFDDVTQRLLQRHKARIVGRAE